MKNQNHLRSRAVSVPMSLSTSDLAVIDGGASQSEQPPPAGGGQQQPAAGPPQLPVGTSLLDMQWKQVFGEKAAFPGSRPKTTLAGMLNM